MTRTGLVHLVTPACARTVPYRPVRAQVRPCGPGRVLPAARAAHPGCFPRRSTPFKPAARRLAFRSCRPRSVRPPLPCQRAWELHAPCPRPPALSHRLNLQMLRWRSAPLYACSRDPGRDILCLLSSALRRLRWP